MRYNRRIKESANANGLMALRVRAPRKTETFRPLRVYYTSEQQQQPAQASEDEDDRQPLHGAPLQLHSVRRYRLERETERESDSA